MFSRAGSPSNCAATLPAGTIGLWCSDSSDNSFDDFRIQDVAGPFETDGRWFSTTGGVHVDRSNSNLLEFDTGSDYDHELQAVRRGFRGDKFVLTGRFQWTPPCKPGLLVRWIDSGNRLHLQLPSDDGKLRLNERVDDGPITAVATSTTALSLTSGNWYTMKAVVDDDPNDAQLQRLRAWVDTDDDGDFADETTLITTTAVDDEWSAGYVGLCRGSGDATVLSFDDFKVGIDHNADGDILDAGDDVEIDDDFSSNSVTLAYDNNGNLTDDGVFQYVYDGWNRLRKATRRVDAETLVAEYRYDGRGRRVRTVITSSGPEIQAADGGETDTHFYVDRSGRVIETRNGSNQVTFQYLRGRSGELVWAETNGDPTIGNDASPDNEATGEDAESPADVRYFAHADRGGALVALTEYDTEGTNNGRIVERYAWARHGFHVTLDGDGGCGERGGVGGAARGGVEQLCDAEILGTERSSGRWIGGCNRPPVPDVAPPKEEVPRPPPPPCRVGIVYDSGDVPQAGGRPADQICDTRCSGSCYDAFDCLTGHFCRIEVIDHGCITPGVSRQQCGREPLPPGLGCDKLEPSGSVVLWGCNTGADPVESSAICGYARACRGHLICGCTGTSGIDGTGNLACIGEGSVLRCAVSHDGASCDAFP